MPVPLIIVLNDGRWFHESERDLISSSDLLLIRREVWLPHCEYADLLDSFAEGIALGLSYDDALGLAGIEDNPERRLAIVNQIDFFNNTPTGVAINLKPVKRRRSRSSSKSKDPSNKPPQKDSEPCNYSMNLF